MSETKSRKEIVRKFGHLLGGFVIFLKGYDKFIEHHSPIGILLMILGVIFAAFALFHHKFPWIEKHEAWLLWLEAIALALVTYYYFADGRFALPIVYALCSICYFIVGFVRYRQQKSHT